jgi:hypothetical protein
MVLPTSSPSHVALDQVVISPDGRWVVPDGWQQGRGAWGGLIIAAVVRAAVQAEAEAGFPDRSVRSVSANIVAPVLVGEAQVSVAQVRRGSATATWQVAITQEAQSCAHATVVFGDPRRGDAIAHTAPTPPDVPAWTTVEPVFVGPPLAPPFFQHLSMRPVSGLPYSGSQDEVVAWLSYPRGDMDAAALLALVDGPWPVSLVRITQPRPMATLSFMATALIDPHDIDTTQPLLFSSTLLGVNAGYATEQRRLWTPDGRLAVENLQLITIIK